MRYKLLLCSEEDAASVNIKDALISLQKWEDDGNFLYFEGMAMMTIPDIHIRAENIDKRAEEAGLKVGEIIFLSRHKAASGIPTLTVHPIGNFNDAEMGGRPRSLVMSSPAVMTGLLRSLPPAGTDGYEVSFEVTHHGPWTDVPSTFIEIGSDSTQWGRREAGMMIASAVYSFKEDNYTAATGIGGGHYAPRFTELAGTHQINFGHMIPEYAFKDSDDIELIRMLTEAAEKSGTKLVYVHKKSMKGELSRRVINAIGSCGLEMISSRDLNAI